MVAALCFTAVTTVAARAQEKTTYDDHVEKIFEQHCSSCHGDDKQKAGLHLTAYSGVIQGSSSGPVVVSGDPDNSVLYLAITHKRTPNMPPGGRRIPDSDIATIRKWIESGLLENAGSQAKPKKKANPALQSVVATLERPAVPPPMPRDLLLEPAVVSVRPGAIVSLAANPWAPLVALGGQRQVLLYDTRSLELVGVLPFPEGLPCSLAFTRDGKLLVAGGGKGAASGRVVAWNVEDGARVVEAGVENDVVLASDLSADRRLVALGGPGKLVKVLDTQSGDALHKLKKHTDWVTALAFSPDGVLLASGDRNGGLVVWETQSGREYQTLLGPTAAITSIAWRDDANVLAASSEDGTVRLFEMFEGKEVKKIDAHKGGASSVALAHDGRIASCGRDHEVKVWSADGQLVKSFGAMGELALKVAFDTDGTRVIAGDWNGTVQVWNVADAAKVGTLTLNPPRVDDRLLAAQNSASDAQQKLGAAKTTVSTAQSAADGPLAQLAAARALQEPVARKAADAEQKLAAAKQQAESVAAALTQAAKELDAARADESAKSQAAATALAANTQLEGELRHAEQVEADRKSLAARMSELAAAARAAASSAQDDVALQEAASRAEEAAAKAKQSHENAAAALAAAGTRQSAAVHALDEARAAASAASAATKAAEARKGEQSTKIAEAGAQQSAAESALAAAKSELAPLEQASASAAAAAKPFEESLAAAKSSLESASSASLAAQRDVARWRAARVNVDLHAARAELAAADVDVAARQNAVAAAHAPVDALAAEASALEKELAESPLFVARLESQRSAARAAADEAAKSVESARALAQKKLEWLHGCEAYHALLASRAAKQPADAAVALDLRKAAESLAQAGESSAAARADVARQEELAAAAEHTAAAAAHEVAQSRARAADLPSLLAAKRHELELAQVPLTAASSDLAGATSRRAAVAARVDELTARYTAELAASR